MGVGSIAFSKSMRAQSVKKSNTPQRSTHPAIDFAAVGTRSKWLRIRQTVLRLDLQRGWLRHILVLLRGAVLIELRIRRLSGTRGQEFVEMVRLIKSSMQKLA